MVVDVAVVVDGLLADEGRVAPADLDHHLALMEEALAQDQELPSQADQELELERGTVLEDHLLDGIELVAHRLDGIALIVHHVLEQDVHEEVGALAHVGGVERDRPLQLLEQLRVASPVPAHGDQEAVAEEEVHLADADPRAFRREGVQEDEGVAREILDLRDLLRVEAVLHRERMEAERLDQRLELGSRGVHEVEPDVAAPLGGLPGLRQPGDAAQGPVLADMRRCSLGHRHFSAAMNAIQTASSWSFPARVKPPLPFLPSSPSQ